MNTHIIETADIADFLLAGRAVFTLKSKKTDRHYTYKVTLADKRDEDSPWDNWFVALLTGGEEYVYIGMLARNGERSPFFKTTAKTRNPTAPSVRGFGWFVKHLFDSQRTIDQVEFWHEGRCGRCSRPLTDPESIKSGIGPICRGH